ncbi:squamosa promoter-binding-like protein 7 isoform X1 [Coffea arabica]|uniref:Squamosa promoter-binding-like protein 7 isoform X1 n=1 Tax=Coffea arabica TaxID=13443 RepID=A0A6P6X2F6_COFAR|nr:squamosa promoter-binding-like protein 7 [Coffea arabica]
MDNSSSPSIAPISPSRHQTHPKPLDMSNASMISAILEDPTNSSLFDWSDFLDFNIDVEPFASAPFAADQQQQEGPVSPSDSDQVSPLAEDPGRVRKRDPRLVCSNFLAGRVPCACPELDEKLELEEVTALGEPGKKRPRTVRVPAGSNARCQVTGCGADISELKGYHKRHRVCLQCANAGAVVLDGQSKRYCQQCGKFHILSDFDEGKRSCRRKLERHNNRRRRKPNDPKGTVETEHQQTTVAEDVSGDDDAGKDGICLSSENAEKETLLESEGQQSTLCSAHDSQNIQNNSIVTSGSYGDTQIYGEKENPKYSRSPSFCDNKNAFSSVCPTGRISFKLYDWNPAEFPRRLRHQIFQWLASMPVELEGYIRPGCTILTVFIAMPKFMWVKLSEKPAECLHNLVLSPGSMLSGRDTFHIYLNNMIFRVIKGGSSLFKVKVNEQAPKLHHVHPTCFEAGKPMEFVACGSNLLPSKLRFLVSFTGKYLAHDLCVSSSCGKTEGDAGSLNHHSFKISVPQTEPGIFGPAFVEVENEFGLSNFIPVLIGDKEICAEMNIMQQRFAAKPCIKGLQLSATSSCGVSDLRQTEFSEFIMDVAWSLKKPVMKSSTPFLTSVQIKRFTNLLNFLIENESTAILDRVVYYTRVLIDNNFVATNITDADMEHLWMNLDKARDILYQKLQRNEHQLNNSRKFLLGERSFNRTSLDHMSSVATSNSQGEEVTSKAKLTARVDISSHEGGTTVPLLTGEVVMRVNVSERPGKSCSPLLIKTGFSSRPLIFALTAATVCIGLCAVLFHPEKVGEVATTIRKCLEQNS